MISLDTHAAADAAPSTTNGTSLTFDAVKAHFPHVLDVRAGWTRDSHPMDAPVAEWFKTESTEPADPSTLPRIIGRAYYLKHGEQIDSLDTKRYLRKHRNGSAEKPVPLNELAKLVSDAVDALAAESTEGKKKKSPYLTFIDMKAEFPHLFETDAIGRVGFSTRKTAVDAWFETAKTNLVDPAALPKIIGRAFYLKQRKLIHPSFIKAYLNGAGEKPVPLNELSKLVSEAVAALVKGPKIKPDPQPDDVGAERPVYMVPSIFKPRGRNKKKVVHDRYLNLVKRNSPDALVSVARGRLTPLKGTAPEKAKGTGKMLCDRVFKSMRQEYTVDEVDDDLLSSCITAAWDQIGGFGAGYEGNQKAGKTSGTKPLNLSPRR